MIEVGESKILRSQDNQRGVALISIILLLGLLTALVTTLSVYVINGATAVSIERDRIMTDELAVSALEFGMGRALSTPNGFPIEGEDKIRIQSGEAIVSWRAETGRLNINLADEPTLVAIFRSAGLTSEQSELLSKLIIARRTLDKSQPLPKEFQILRSSKLGPFSHIRELLDLPGVSEDLFRNIEPLLTVYNPAATIDPRLADPLLLRSLPDMSPTILAGLADLRGRTDEDATRRLSALGSASRLFDFTRSQVVRFSIAIKPHSGAQRLFHIVAIHFPDDSRPYRVLAWRDEELGQL